MKLFASALIFLALTFGAAAQSQPVDTLPRPAEGGTVSLRDYVSARFDQLKQFVDERDRLRDIQQGQRFEAQQKALADALQATQKSAADALQAIKETTSNTLASAKEAVAKAENANERRFESQNEFRQTLIDQAATFTTKAEAEARQEAVNARQLSTEEDVARLTARIDEERSRSEGASNLWLLIVGIISVFVLLLGFGVTLFTLKQRMSVKA